MLNYVQTTVVIRIRVKIVATTESAPVLSCVPCSHCLHNIHKMSVTWCTAFLTPTTDIVILVLHMQELKPITMKHWLSALMLSWSSQDSNQQLP